LRAYARNLQSPYTSTTTTIAAQNDKLQNATIALSESRSMQNEGDLNGMTPLQSLFVDHTSKMIYEKSESSSGRLGRDKKGDSFSVGLSQILHIIQVRSSVHSQSGIYLHFQVGSKELLSRISLTMYSTKYAPNSQAFYLVSVGTTHKRIVN